MSATRAAHPKPPKPPKAPRPPKTMTPSLRQVVMRDLRPRDLPANFRRDLRRLYHFYLDEERRAELASMGRIRRFFKLIAWTLKSLLAKLSPGRRLALTAAMILWIIGGQSHFYVSEVDRRGIAFLILLFVLMLELEDKLLAKDEIEVARQVQLALLPQRHPQPQGWSLSSYMRPANDVGADLVDYIDHEDGRLGVALGDVAGKGLGAALLTAKLQATLRAIAPDTKGLRELGATLNTVFHRDGIDNRYVTLFYFTIEPGTGRLRYLNAGHNPPMILRLTGETETLEPSAIPIGMMAGTTYAEGSGSLEPGDILVAYSDGLTEARNPAGAEFGVDRLRALLPGIRGLNADQAVTKVIADVNRFLAGERPHDDLSLLVAIRETGLTPAGPGQASPG